MLTIQKLSKSYGKRLVLQDLSLHIQPGEIYGLLGLNGAGKTTTINIICNLLQADSGAIATLLNVLVPVMLQQSQKQK